MSSKTSTTIFNTMSTYHSPLQIPSAIRSAFQHRRTRYQIKFWLKIIALFLLWGVLLPRVVHAQTIARSVVATAGQTLGSVDFTLGEPVVQSLENGATLDQGFQQIWLVATPVQEVATEDSSARVFPNPTVGLLQVETDAAVQARLFDTTGRQVLTTNLNGDGDEMNLGELPVGTYLLMLQAVNGTQIKSFKINKVQ